jgi:RimJ/RimL family protein N-acetyltransferase
MISPESVTLEAYGIRLEPLERAHSAALMAAAADVRNIDRVEIGYTFYAQRWQRTHVNTACKLLLLGHAFDTLGCKVVGFRVDNLNERSQKAVEALGAKKDGVIRHFQARRDGSARDTYMYSILAAEWPGVKRHLESRVERLRR